MRVICMHCRDPLDEHTEEQLMLCMNLLDANEHEDLVDVDVEIECPDCGTPGCDCWLFDEEPEEEDLDTIL